MMFSRDGLKVTNSHGWQSVRANVALKEGTYFWEVKVLSNCIDEKNASFHPQLKPGGHIRVGIMRPEGNIEANLGIDGYSYAVTDYNMRIIHAGFQHQLEKDSSRSFRIGDVFGLRLTLPPLAIHRKVVDGSYNPAVDGPETWSLAAETINPASNVVRDRNPFFFKQKHLFFEQQNYNHEELGQANPIIMKGWKVMLDRLYAGGDKSYRNLNLAPMKDDGLQAPNPNHPDSRYRTLPGSKLELFRNGEYLGVIVEDLLAFLVPSSKLHSGGEDRPPGREYADDGSLGYYPAVSSYYGGAAECRFEPPFWFPPATADDAAAPADETGPSVSSTKKAKKGKGKAAPGPVPNRRVYEPVETKSFVDRHNEQIAEEIVFDIIDEVEAGLADELKALDEVDLGVPDAGFVTAAAHSIKMEE
jgi:COMPASS component BRE2